MKDMRRGTGIIQLLLMLATDRSHNLGRVMRVTMRVVIRIVADHNMVTSL